MGKDVTRIALPVHLNEPLSFTQVVCVCVCVCVCVGVGVGVGVGVWVCDLCVSLWL